MAHKVSLKYGDQRKLCATCKGPIRTFALTSCYHAPLCGRCTSRTRYFFDRMNCFVCGHLETHTIYTWQPSLQYEDFDLKTDDRLCHDVDMGVVYQGHSERNKDMRMLGETNEKKLNNVSQRMLRNAVCKIINDQKEVFGTAFLVKLLGHRCLLTANNVVPNIEMAKTLYAEFCLEDGSSFPEHVEHGKYNHPYTVTLNMALRPDFLFLTNHSLNFTVIAFEHFAGGQEFIAPTPILLPTLSQRPQPVKDERNEFVPGEEIKAESETTKTSVNSQSSQKLKRNFVIVKKIETVNENTPNMGGNVETRKHVWDFPSKNDIIRIIAFPLNNHSKQSDIQLVDSIEQDTLIYKNDTDPKSSGAPVFFNSALVAVHNQSEIKDNADEATVIFSILAYILSHRVESLRSFCRAIHAQPSNVQIQKETTRHFLQFASKQTYSNQLVKSGVISALLQTCQSCWNEPDTNTPALESLVWLCKWSQNNSKLVAAKNGVAILVAIIKEDAMHHFEHVLMLRSAWCVLGYISKINSCAHELAESGGPSLVVGSMYAEVSDVVLVLGGLNAIKGMAVDERHHGLLIEAEIVRAIFLVIGAHEKSEEVQLAGVTTMASLIANNSAMPANSSFHIGPVKQYGRKKSPEKEQRKHQTSRFDPMNNERGFSIPLRGGKRDRQLMKRTLRPTALANSAKTLGELVQTQPRSLIMWTKNGLGALFVAMKNFPTSVAIAERVWSAMDCIKNEALSKTDTCIELHGSHLHVMKKNLRRMKDHPKIEEWRTLYTILEQNNERKKKK